LLHPEVELGARKNIFRIREGRHPAAVFEFRIPADMVDMHMSAQHEVDIFRCHARCAEIIHPRENLIVEHIAVARLVIADTGIDQNGVVRRADQKGLDVNHHLATDRIEMARHHPVFMGLHRTWIPVGKKFRRAQHQHFHLDDTGDADIAEAEIEHGNHSGDYSGRPGFSWPQLSQTWFAGSA
jgi:hypothetical protein